MNLLIGYQNLFRILTQSVAPHAFPFHSEGNIISIAHRQTPAKQKARLAAPNKSPHNASEHNTQKIAWA